MSRFDWNLFRRRRAKPNARRPCECAVLQVESLEPREVFNVSPVEQFLLDSMNLYSLSTHPADLGSPVVRFYSDAFAGGSYALRASEGNVSLDDNDPDAGFGLSGTRATRIDTTPGVNAYFEFSVGLNGPRDIPDFGFAHQVRLMAKGDADGQQLKVKVHKFNTEQITSVITLTTQWKDFVIDLPTGITPAEIRAVQFILGDDGLNVGNNTFRVDEVRLGVDGFDPLRLVQSHRPISWAASGDNANNYQTRSYLYDNALTIKALWSSDDPAARTTALQLAAAVLATELPDGSYYNERSSGRALKGDGTPRGPSSQLRTLGDNAWFGLALTDLYVDTGDASYLAAARRISDWAETDLKVTGGLGGYRGGYLANGTPIWRGTEFNIDLFALNRRLGLILTSLGDAAATNYAQRATHAGNFVTAMFDDDNSNIDNTGGDGKFWTGTTGTDDFNKATIPLDAQVWAIMAMASDPEYAAALDWNLPLAWAEANLAATDGAFSGVRYSSNQVTPNKVWFEGTAQLALLYALRGNAAAYTTTLAKVEFARLNHPNGDGLGIVAASSDGLVEPAFAGLNYDARLHVGASAWFDLAQSQINPFTLSIEPPKVTGVYAAGSTWQSAYTGHLADGGLGHTGLPELGYRLSVGADQLRTLPWRNVDTLSIRFSEAVSIAQGDLTVVAASNGAAIPAVTGFSWDSTNFVASWTFASALPPDKYLLHLADSVVDAGSGAALDGEWITGTSTASGNGTAGGDFDFRFNVLWGDVDGSSSVTFGEIGRQWQNLNLTTASGGFNYRQDLDGTGSVTFEDVDQARLRLGAMGNDDEPTAPAGASGGGDAGPETFGRSEDPLVTPSTFSFEMPTRFDRSMDPTLERTLTTWRKPWEQGPASGIEQAFAAALAQRRTQAAGTTTSPALSAGPELRNDVESRNGDGRRSIESQRVAVDHSFREPSADELESAEFRGRFARFANPRRGRRG